MAVLLHVICDAANNLGVMAAALVMWLAHYKSRYYADPGVSMGIAVMIIVSAFPLSEYREPSALRQQLIHQLFSTKIRTYLARERTSGCRSE